MADATSDDGADDAVRTNDSHDTAAHPSSVVIISQTSPWWSRPQNAQDCRAGLLEVREEGISIESVRPTKQVVGFVKCNTGPQQQQSDSLIVQSGCRMFVGQGASRHSYSPFKIQGPLRSQDILIHVAIDWIYCYGTIKASYSGIIYDLRQKLVLSGPTKIENKRRCASGLRTSFLWAVQSLITPRVLALSSRPFLFPFQPEQNMSEQQQKGQQYGDLTYKDQMREARLPSSSLGTAEGTGERAAVTDDIPFVGAVAVSESRMAAEEHEDRLQAAERRATAAEAARRDQEARLAQLERQMAAVLPPSLQQVRDIGNLNDDRLEVIDGDDNNVL
jgi:hypothetical protein